MNNPIIRNAYFLLGIDISASQKDIIKRSKEIITRLKIDDIPQYDLDLEVIQNFRNENDVKKAQQDLSEPQKRMLNYFFWFDIQDTIDEKAIRLIKSKDFSNAVKTWKINLEGNSLKSNIYKKNLCVLYCLLLLTSTDQNESYIKESLILWKTLIDSEKFWTAFYKVYKLNDDVDTSSSILSEFPKKVVESLSDIYTDIEKRYKNSLVLLEFSKTFKIKSDKLENEVLNPIYEEITSHNEYLNNIKITKEIPFEPKTFTEIKNEITKLQENFKQLQKLGYYDDSQTKKLRDNSASSIRRIYLDLYNYHGEHGMAEELLKIGREISGTESQEFIFKEDLKILEKNKKQNEISDVLTKYLKEEKFEASLKLIEKEESQTSNTELKLFLSEQKKGVITNIFAKKYKEADDLFNQKDFDESDTLYKDIIALIWKDIDVFNLNKEVISKITEEINTKISSLKSANLVLIDNYRNQLVKDVEDKLGNTFEAIILRFLIDSYIHSGVIPIIKRQRAINSRKKWIGWIIFIGFILISALFNSSHNSNSNTSSSDDCSNVSPGQYCCSSANSAQADTMKPDPSVKTQLDSDYTKINNERTYLDNTDQAAINAFNAEVDQYNIDKNAYNSKMDQYNNFLAQNCTLK